MQSLLQSRIAQLLSRPALESVPSEDGMEREYVFFGEMVDKIDLEKATSFSDQIQYRIIVPAKEKGREISVRIRKTIPWTVDESGTHRGEDVYTLTIKSFVKGEEGCAEAENVLDEAAGKRMLEIFQANGSDGLIKRRYVFPPMPGYLDGQGERMSWRCKLPPEMVWEVDVPKEFRDLRQLDRSEVADGGNWVKLDLEVKGFNWDLTDDSFQLPFPIRMDNIIYQQPGKRDKATEAKVKEALGQLRTKD